MSLNSLGFQAHQISVSKGWWEQERNPMEIAALIHSEVSEFVEEERKAVYDESKAVEELADVIIRVLDYCAYRKWDIDDAVFKKMLKNKSREVRHGGKRY